MNIKTPEVPKNSQIILKEVLENDEIVVYRNTWGRLASPLMMLLPPLWPLLWNCPNWIRWDIRENELYKKEGEINKAISKLEKLIKERDELESHLKDRKKLLKDYQGRSTQPFTKKVTFFDKYFGAPKPNIDAIKSKYKDKLKVLSGATKNLRMEWRLKKGLSAHPYDKPDKAEGKTSVFTSADFVPILSNYSKEEGGLFDHIMPFKEPQKNNGNNNQKNKGNNNQNNRNNNNKQNN
jgi:hypothetical protein